MSQARIMTIHVDQHMAMLEVGAKGKDRQEQIAYWREVIPHAEKIEGWFGRAIADRARWKIRVLGGSIA